MLAKVGVMKKVGKLKAAKIESRFNFGCYARLVEIGVSIGVPSCFFTSARYLP
jgi:hypothetical protein